MADGSSDKARFKEIDASEILAKIEKGESFEYNHIIVKGDLDISSLALPNEDGKPVINSKISITNSQIDGDVNFDNTIFKRYINFEKTYFAALASFVRVQFNGFNYISDDVVNFKGAYFDQLAHFYGAYFTGGAIFKGAKFSKFGGYIDRARFCDYALFDDARFEGDAYFKKTCFDGLTRFSNVQFKGHTHFRFAKFRQYTSFERAHFDKPVYLDETKFEGDHLTFRNALFFDPLSQEDACRRAKNVLEKTGDKEEAGYHFYQEMEAKRKQKPWYVRYPEFIFIQKIFGYGVHPWRLMFWWGIVVIIFAILYQAGNGIIGAMQPCDYIKVSFATAIAPGYIAVIINPGGTGYRLISEYQVVAMAETIVGTFLWAGFIATFARKYMR